MINEYRGLRKQMKNIKAESEKLIIICGHYGAGKTNLSMNMALDFASSGEDITLIDLDIVNPYFRTGDYSEMMEAEGVRVVAPNFVNSNLDLPSISGAVGPAILGPGRVIIDVGGDDAGSTVLGRFSEDIKERGYDMYYVINMYRTFTENPEDTVQIMKEIEGTSGLKVTGIINNSHLKNETTVEDIEATLDYAEKTAELADLPLIFTTAPLSVALCLQTMYAYPVEVLVKTTWE